MPLLCGAVHWVEIAVGIGMSAKHLSTTALARQLGKERKELFSLLARSGWILKVDDHWQLTAKGKFEGGIYVNHPRYGEYIAWPEALLEHPLLALLPEAPLTAGNLGQKLGLPARLVNLLLAERGWLLKALRGWLLTPRGKALGGQQQRAESSGIPFVTWPETLLEEPALLAAVAQLNPQVPFAQEEPALDGHVVANHGQRLIDNWLYLTGVVHARGRTLVLPDAVITPDFYLPGSGLCLDYWGEESGGGEMTAKMERQALCRRYDIPYVELRSEELVHLDEVLSRILLQYDIAVY